MKLKSMRPGRLLIRLLGLGLGVALTMTAAGCDRETAAAFDAAEACIDARPDSALTLIRESFSVSVTPMYGLRRSETKHWFHEFTFGQQ